MIGLDFCPLKFKKPMFFVFFIYYQPILFLYHCQWGWCPITVTYCGVLTRGITLDWLVRFIHSIYVGQITNLFPLCGQDNSRKIYMLDWAWKTYWPIFIVEVAHCYHLIKIFAPKSPFHLFFFLFFTEVFLKKYPFFF